MGYRAIRLANHLKVIEKKPISAVETLIKDKPKTKDNQDTKEDSKSDSMIQKHDPRFPPLL